MSVLRDFAKKVCTLVGGQAQADKAYTAVVRTPVTKQQLAERVLDVFNKQFATGSPQPVAGGGTGGAAQSATQPALQPVPHPVPQPATQAAAAQLILKPGELDKVRDFLKTHREAQSKKRVTFDMTGSSVGPAVAPPVSRTTTASTSRRGTHCCRLQGSVDQQ